MCITIVASSNLFTPKGWGAFVHLGRGHSAVMFACVKGKDPKMVLQFGYSRSGFYSLSTLYTAIPHMIIAY